MTNKCTLCPELVRKRTVFPITFPPYPLPRHRVMCIAEAPGDEENRRGEPLIGNSGQEARYQLTLNGIASQGVVLTNVCLCQPPGNRDPKPDEINNCTKAHLIPLILKHKPDFIISMGRISTRFFLGDVNMELSHGIPRPINFHGHSVVIIPTYHPAAGLHNPEQMILFQSDLRITGDIIRGKLSSNPPEDKWAGKEDYRETDDPSLILDVIGNHKVVAIDTEWARGGPWCLSISVTPGQSLVVFRGSKAALDIINAVLSSPDTTTVIQNALYDLPVLAPMGIHPARVADTMVMAYLLQTEPQGLKPLSFRHCGMKMTPYTQMVGGVTVTLAQEYLEKVMEMEWPDPEPVLEWIKGEPKVRKPQNIKRKVKRILNDKGANPAERWKAIKDGKEIVEAVLGPFQAGELCDIPRPEAVQYSARDADATIRIYPILWRRIEAMGLAPTFWRDMGAMPMVVDMMANGMPVDLEAFSKLSGYFQQKMDEIQRKMQKEVGFYFNGVSINPASYPQMSSLIYDYLCLQDIGGKFKSKKGAVKKSTADDILKRYVGIHPSVQDIINWRGYQKLKTSYADAIPQKVGTDNRVRTTIRMTRVATGRLSSSNPNLMAQPVRSSEGRKIRDCYVAEDGMVLLSGDYSQVEMRVAANDSKDEVMMSIFWEGKDIHAVTASNMFGIPISQLDEMKHRYPAKRVGFGILNLITAEGLQRELSSGGAGGWSVSDCQEMIKSWFQIYKGVAAYMKASGEQAKRYGYIRDMWGRLRYIPGIRSVNRWSRIEAERQAGNAPIQMGAQGVIKEAMGRLVPVYREMNKEIGIIRPLIQIHDDIVWEVEEWMVGIVTPIIRKIMIGAITKDFIIPLEVDFKSGKKWGSMKKL